MKPHICTVQRIHDEAALVLPASLVPFSTVQFTT